MRDDNGRDDDYVIVYVSIRCVACLPVLCLLIVLVLICLREHEIMVNDSSSSSSSWRSMSSDRMCPICLETFGGVDSTAASTPRDHPCSSHGDDDNDDDDGEETSPLLVSSSSGDGTRNLQSYHVTTTTTATTSTTSTGGCTNNHGSPTITFACGHVVGEPCWESLVLHNEQHQRRMEVLADEVAVAPIPVRCPICRAIVLGGEE